MKEWRELPLAYVGLEGYIKYIHIIDLEIHSEVNHHATAVVRVLLDKTGNLYKIKDNKVTIKAKDGTIIFKGICIDAYIEKKSQYREAVISIISDSYQLEKKYNNRTFQNPQKTLRDIAETVSKEASVQCETDCDLNLTHIVYQNEDNWNFLRKLANQYGYSIWATYRGEIAGLNIGARGTGRNIELNEYSYKVKEEKQVGEYRESILSGKEPSLYEYTTSTYITDNYIASAGDCCQDGLVIKTRLTSDKGVLRNEVCVLNSSEYLLDMQTSNARAFASQILSGKVIHVEQDKIKVAFDVDANQSVAEAVTMPYESVLSNAVYTMPDEDEKVFVYTDNQGETVCLGSKRTDTTDPLFNNPKEKVFDALENIIHLRESACNLSATRKMYDKNAPIFEVSISLDDGEGLKINSKHNIDIQALNEVFLGIGKSELMVEALKEKVAEIQSELITGEGNYNAVIDQYSKEYVPLKGIPDYSLSFDSYIDSFGLRASAEWGRAKENIVSGAKDLIFWDWWHQPDPLAIDYSLAECTTSKMLFSSKQITLSVGNACLAMGVVEMGEVTIAAGVFSWVGRDITKDYPIKADELRDFWEIGLDIVLAGLAIAAAVCAIVGTGGAAAPFIIAGVAGVISLSRGDYFSAITACVSTVFGLFKLPATLDKVYKTVLCIYGFASAVYQDIKIVQATIDRVKNADSILEAGFEVFNGFLQFMANNASVASSVKDVNDAYKKTSTGTNSGGGTDTPTNPTDTPTNPTDTPTNPTDTSTNPVDADSHQNSTTDGDPVNVATGALTEKHTDLRLKDIRTDFRAVRSYKSTRRNPGRMLGERWLFQFESSLYRRGNRCNVYLPDDHLESFVVDEDGAWTNDVADKERYVLTTEEDGYLLCDRESQDSYYYGRDGFIRYIMDGFGNRTIYTYDDKLLKRITLESGQYLEFYYIGKKLSRLIDSQGRSYEYQYKGELLEAVTYPHGGVVRYEYTPEGYITRIQNENGKVYLHNTFDRKGRVVRQETADGEEYVFFYNDALRETTVTKVGLNRSVVYSYNRNHLVESTRFEDGTSLEKRYDANEKVIWEKDRLGNITERIYNKCGQIEVVKYPNGLENYYAYNEQGKCIAQTDNQGKNYQYSYDEKGNISEVSIEVEKGRYAVIKYEVDEHGRTTAQIYPDGSKKNWVYKKPFMQPTAYHSPENEEITYELDAYGRIAVLQTADGEVHYAYNSLHQVTMIQDEEKNITRYTYDLLGLRTGVRKPEDVAADDGQGITYRYDAMDHLLDITDACGTVYARKVNSEGKLLKLIEPETYDHDARDGEGVEYQYDMNGNCTHRKHRDGAVYRYFYDANGNMTKYVLPEDYQENIDDGAGKTYTYDSMNRLLTVRDKQGVLIRKNTYDLAGRLISYTNEKLLALSTNKEISAHYQYNHVGWLTQERVPVRQTGDRVEYRVRTYEYDLRGNVTCEKRYLDYQDEESRKGRILLIHKEYDRSGRLIRVTDSLGACMEYRYNFRNQISLERMKIREGIYKEKEYTYTASGRLESIVESADAKEISGGKAITRLQYDKNGNLIRVVTPTGNEIRYAYDRAGRKTATEMKQQDGKIRNKVLYEYSRGNRVIQKTTDGRPEHYTYDVCGRRSTIRNMQGKTTAFRYDLDGRLVAIVGPQQYDEGGADGKAMTWLYENDRLIRVSMPDGSTVRELGYDEYGDNIYVKEAGVEAKNCYDLLGRRTLVEGKGKASQQVEYDPWGHVVGVTDGNGNTTVFEVDGWGRTLQVNRADGGIESYTYDNAGNMIQATDGLGHSTCFVYNEMNCLSKRIDPSGEVEYWNYDAEGRPRRYRDRNGNEQLYTYNMYGELTRRHVSGVPGMEELYGYDEEGRLSYCIGGGMRYDYSYDDFGRLAAKSASGRTLISYEYDDYNRVQARTDLTGKRTEYHYDEIGRLLQVEDEGIEQAAYSYDEESRLLSKISGELQTFYSYDADGNISRMQAILAGEALFDNLYSYDGNGNCISVQGTDNLTTYAYDCMNRLAEAEYAGHKETYAYDYADNRISKEYYERLRGVEVDRMETAGKVPLESEIYGAYSFREEYSYDERNRLTGKQIYTAEAFQEPMETDIYLYDANGNLLKDKQAEYTYDGFNRLSEVRTTEGGYQRNAYDAEGLRAELVENGELVRFLYHNGEVIAETKEREGTLRYIRGLGIISSDSESAKTYYHYVSDEHGSITDIVKAAVRKKLSEDSEPETEVLNHYEYDAFGNMLVCEEQVENRLRFTGEIYDAVSGQYYLRARFYNPVLGRFIQEDDRYTDGLNLYAYCKNNPVRYTDPTGHSVVSPGDRDVNFYVGPDGTVIPADQYDPHTGGARADFYVDPSGNVVPGDVIYVTPNGEAIPGSMYNAGGGDGSRTNSTVSDPYAPLRERGIPQTLTDAEIAAANRADLQMMADVESGTTTISSADRIKIDAWDYTPSDELYSKYKNVFDNPKYYNQKTGAINWPKNDGFASTPIDEVLQPGTRIDRYGSDFGSFTSPEGIPYEMRAVAPGTDLKPYSVFEVVEPINVKAGEIAPWFDEPGGGIQYLLPDTVDELLDAGILRRIK